MIDKAFYNHFCNEVTGSRTTETQGMEDNDTNVVPESQGLDTWDTKAYHAVSIETAPSAHRSDVIFNFRLTAIEKIPICVFCGGRVNSSQMFYSDQVRKRINFLLIVGLLALVICTITLWTTSSFMIDKAFYNHFCNEVPGSGTTKTQGVKDNDTNVAVAPAPAPESQGLDTWDTKGAEDYLKKFNERMNNNTQPMTADPKNISTITEWWQAAAMFSWYLHSPLRYVCQHLVWYGNWAVCQDEQYKVKKPCLVYSFGIAFDYRFDDAIGNIGCDVRAFDPSMNVSDHRHSSSVLFYAIGISSTNTNVYIPKQDSYVKRPQKWKLRTLKAIRRDLGHTDRVLDVLKLDIETFEWEVIDNIIETELLKYVRHLLVEYHFFPRDRPPLVNYVYYFRVHTLLRQLGFREYYSSPHTEILVAGHFRHQGEVLYVNARFNSSNLPNTFATNN